MRFGLELMGRLHQETMPEVVARAISDALTSGKGGLFVGADASTGLPFDLLKRVWADRESDRLANLALHYPAIMSRRERELWERIESSPVLEPAWRTEIIRARTQSRCLSRRLGVVVRRSKGGGFALNFSRGTRRA